MSYYDTANFTFRPPFCCCNAHIYFFVSMYTIIKRLFIMHKIIYIANVIPKSRQATAFSSSMTKSACKVGFGHIRGVYKNFLVSIFIVRHYCNLYIYKDIFFINLLSFTLKNILANHFMRFNMWQAVWHKILKLFKIEKWDVTHRAHKRSPQQRAFLLE